MPYIDMEAQAPLKLAFISKRICILCHKLREPFLRAGLGKTSSPVL